MATDVVEAPTTAVRRWAPFGVFFGALLVGMIPAWNISLWTDESVTISAATRSWEQLWALLANVDAVHGMYYAIMVVWTNVFGTDEFLLRLPSALAAGGTAVGVYVLTRRLAAPSTALIAAALVAILPRMAWAGIEARPFVFSALLAVWATWALVVADDRGGAWRWVRYGAFGALGVASNIYLALLIIAHGITLLVLRRSRRALGAFLVAAIGAAVVTSPLLLLVRSQQGQLGTGIGADRSIGFILRRIVVNQLFLGETPSSEASPRWFELAWQASALVAAALGILLAVAGIVRRAHADDDKKTVLALCIPWIILPTALIAAYAVAIAPVYQPRYFTFTAPAAAILIALGLRALPRRWYTLAGVAVFAVALLVVDVSQRIPYAKSGSDWAAASAIIAERAEQGDAVLFEPRYDYPDDDVFVTSRRIATAYPGAFEELVDLTIRETGAETGTLDGRSVKLGAIESELSAHDRIWVLYGRNHPEAVVERDEELLISSGFQQATTWRGPHTTIVEYTK